MPVSIRLLEVEQVRPGVFQESLDIEHVNVRPLLFECEPFLDHRRAHQVRETDTGRTRSQEEVPFVAQLRPLEPGRIDHARQHDSRRALHVVVIDAVLVAVTLEQVDGDVWVTKYVSAGPSAAPGALADGVDSLGPLIACGSGTIERPRMAAVVRKSAFMSILHVAEFSRVRAGALNPAKSAVGMAPDPALGETFDLSHAMVLQTV